MDQEGHSRPEQQLQAGHGVPFAYLTDGDQMKTRRRPSWDIRRGVSTLAGSALVGLAAWYAWEHFKDPSAPIAAVFGAVMLHLGQYAWQSRQRALACSLAALSLFAVVISLTAVIGRVASQNDVRSHTIASSNEMRRLAEVEEAEAKDEKDAATKAAIAECSRAANPKADPRGPMCIAAEKREQAARERLDSARERLAVMGVAKVEDSGAKRLAAILPLSEAQIALYQPLLLPIWLELSGLALLTFGLSHRTAAPNEKSRRRKRRTRKPSRDSRPSNVVTFPTGGKLGAAND